ncbi:LPXTG cell wall anchor domain-containing protein [Staphylococcus epidermidis]|uniref:LPXTG cell wall anchor domain-containing protein n=1 Tax=Staphylococcus epidermidis TaxID=1282 RepID=UPI0008DF10BC|nr:LPXTG cell wall anchor domain-containing protein [Staphylococcus epidermidis]MBC8789460.1 LPXTG cell wall anchor domain-containing protein [Staphylococcus epidermidis]MCO6246191.1 LPXTG cell wall anchor domain-containing protein [Staphylococcus epidermidis]MCO6255020.1 LPXTG cell wall anchor domain-containing protein [Staphylococcus epidermidis]MCO6267552.1 LPXTG cell wall anchor domain-containing protein [Staphylococcus epidermidis]MCO6271325.1 LPXTG cell wall anchor domain-containing prot
MKDNKPNNSKLIQTYLSKKTLRYGTASALTLAFYLFNSNVTVYADENTANQNQGTSPKTSQTAPTNNNENTDATAVTTDQNNNDEEEYDASYELPILYVTVWLDDQGNIIKDAVEDAKTPASERQPVKIPGYQHYRTSMSDGITKFIYRKISTAQSSIVENNQQDNNTNKVVETTNQNKDEVNGKEQNQANTSVTNTQITKNEKDEDTKTLQKDKDEKESKDAKTPKKDKKEKITKTPKKDREEKKPVIPSHGKVEKDEDTKITKKDKEDEITTTSKKDNNNDVQDKLPETGKTNDFQNPALIMLLAGLGLLGLFRNKIRE